MISISPFGIPIIFRVDAILALIGVSILITLDSFCLKGLNRVFFFGLLLYVISVLALLFQELTRVIVIFLAFTGIAFFSWGFLRSRKIISNIKAENVHFLELRESLGSLILESEKVSSNLQVLEGKMEVFGAESWRKQNESEEKYFGLITAVIQLIDNYHLISKQNKKTEEIDWLYQSTFQILKDRGISEIPVNKGDVFNGKYHKCVGRKFDDIPKGCISQITRSGYFFKAKNEEDDIVLRETNVVVSDKQSNELIKNLGEKHQ